jgi:anti-sigma regulatory factor (Ser/Thr protein kinase)
VTTASFTLLPTGCSSSSARETLRNVLGSWADEEVRADAALLLTELVANGVRHARSPMQIQLTVGPDLLRAEVRDSSALNPLPREPDEHGGRGVLILNALASSWGRPRASRRGQDRVVRAGWLQPRSQLPPASE